MERWHLLLLFLGTGRAADRTLEPVRIMKGMFLLEMRGGLNAHSYNFEPYDYGPFSASIYRDLELLDVSGLIQRIAIPGRNWSLVHMTDEGRKLAASLEKKAKPEQLELISAVHDEVLDRSFADLLRYIYKEYPQYAVSSVFEQ